MLSNAKVHPTLPVVDLNQARKFYEETLGLKVDRVDPPPAPGVMYHPGLYIYQRGATKADHTVATFEVADVEAEIRELKAKGVVFQDIDIPSMGIKTVNSVVRAEVHSINAAEAEHR
jgi:catechol 2,3-dioxygenase-like lactoylglutathione lyase family enzyme